METNLPSEVIGQIYQNASTEAEPLIQRLGATVRPSDKDCEIPAYSAFILAIINDIRLGKLEVYSTLLKATCLSIVAAFTHEIVYQMKRQAEIDNVKAFMHSEGIDR